MKLCLTASVNFIVVLIDLCMNLVHFKLSSKTNCFISVVVHCTDLNCGHCGMTVLKRCAVSEVSEVMLCARYGSYHMVCTQI